MRMDAKSCTHRTVDSHPHTLDFRCIFFIEINLKLISPGGYGTLEELLEVITWAQLGIHHKPVRIKTLNYLHLIIRLNVINNSINHSKLSEEANTHMMPCTYVCSNVVVMSPNSLLSPSTP